MLLTLILLFLQRLASHTVPLTLYTNYDFTLSSVTALTLDFLFSHFSLSGGTLLCFSLTLVLNSYRLNRQEEVYILTYHLNLVTKIQDHNRIESKQQGKRYPSKYGKKIFSRILYSWHSGTCGTVPMDEMTIVFHR